MINFNNPQENTLEQKLAVLGKEVRETYLLRKDERLRISNNILNHADAPKAIPSPYQSVRFPHFLFMNYGSMALLFVFVFAGILSYVAERSLPGDPLYGVKTNVNENTELLLAFSPQSKAAVQADLSAKRLSEAETLVAENKSSPETDETLTADFQNHLTGFEQSVNAVTPPDVLATLGSTTATTTTATDTNPTLLPIFVIKGLAYQSLQQLSILMGQISNTGVFNVVTATPSSTDLSGTSSTATSSGETATSTASTSTETMAVSFDTGSSTASSTTASTTETSSSSPQVVSSPVLSENQTLDLETQIANAEQITNDGIASLQNEDYVTAYMNFQKAIMEIQNAQAFILNPVSTDDASDGSSTATSTTATSTSN